MRIEKDCWLINKPIAHRGLWGNGIAENSASAYINAAKAGFPIEIDLYQTADGKLVSFHDSTLSRMTGTEGYIYEKTLKELRALKLKDSDERIPTLDEVLEIAEGKSPLLIEFKNQPDKGYIENAVKRLKEYKGDFAVQAFDPMYLNTIRKLAPGFIRGILASHDEKDQPFFKRYILKNMSLNFLCKPDFISYNNKGLPLPPCKIKDKPVLAWTVTDKESAEKIKPFCNNIIFENFIP